MEEKNRPKTRIHLTVEQKKKLFELVNKHPQLASLKGTTELKHKASQTFWEDVAKECNSIPGPKKTWRQWKKASTDLKLKRKKRQRDNTEGSVLSSSGQEESYVNMYDEYQDTLELPEFRENNSDGLNDEMSDGSISELDSPAEEKVFAQSIGKTKNTLINNDKNSSEHSNCYLNCDVLARQEQKKINIKKDYLNFKKNYLRQKLKLLKEQTEALKSIASELSK